MSAKVVLQVISGPIQGKVFEFDKHDTFRLRAGQAVPCQACQRRVRVTASLSAGGQPAGGHDPRLGEHQRDARQRGTLRRAPEHRDVRRRQPVPRLPGGLERPGRDHGGEDQIRVRIGVPRARPAPAVGEGLYVPTQTESFPDVPPAAPPEEQRRAAAPAPLGEPGSSPVQRQWFRPIGHLVAAWSGRRAGIDPPGGQGLPVPPEDRSRGIRVGGDSSGRAAREWSTRPCARWTSSPWR